LLFFLCRLTSPETHRGGTGFLLWQRIANGALCFIHEHHQTLVKFHKAELFTLRTHLHENLRDFKSSLLKGLHQQSRLCLYRSCRYAFGLTSRRKIISSQRNTRDSRRWSSRRNHSHRRNTKGGRRNFQAEQTLSKKVLYYNIFLLFHALAAADLHWMKENLGTCYTDLSH